MKRYHLAKLVQWAGTLDSRKRMQKMVYLLQAGGCPLDADFFLHRYGPYSQDVARLTDDMVSRGLLTETEHPNAMGRQFAYELTDEGAARVAEMEGQPTGRQLKAEMERFAQLAQELMAKSIWELEVASTIAYYHATTGSWKDALNQACQFKSVAPDSEFAKTALQLARSVTA